MTDPTLRSRQQRNLEALSKAEVHQLADSLVLEEKGALEACIEFVLADTKGLWHGRGRAMMCRRLKHCGLAEHQRQQLLSCITGRLVRGDFAEQFRDQLRLALYLDPTKTIYVARRCLITIPKDHVRRFCLWVMKHEEQPP